MKHSFALAIPHTPWVEDRRKSLARLMHNIEVDTELHENVIKTFSDKEPSWAWSLRMWQWGQSWAEQGVTHFVQLNDDAIVPDNFWEILAAMVAAKPEAIIGLQGAHPSLPSMSKLSYRWAKSCAWMVGVGYVIPMDDLRELLAFRKSSPESLFKSMGEDDFISNWCIERQRYVYHPIPTIVDHDISLPSQYNNDFHKHRTATVTWRSFGKELTDPQWWIDGGHDVPLIYNPHQMSCCMCHKERGIVASMSTGLKLGKECIAHSVATMTQAVP